LTTAAPIACGSAKDQIVGRWRQSSGPDGAIYELEFFKDGTVVLVEQKRGSTQQVAGRYSWISDSQIKVEFTGLAALLGAVVTDVRMSGDELHMSRFPNEPATLKRVR
jgi:uncharacterized protein (TIGR03066 family)